MIASKILSALLVASVCSSALCAGLIRADVKGASHEQSEQSGFASPVQIGARKSAESTRLEQAPKIEQQQQQQKTYERLEQIKQEPAAQLKEEYPPLEQVAQIKQEEYREEIKSAPAPAPVKGERKAPAVKTQQQQVRFTADLEQRREEPQKEFKQEKIQESFEQKKYQQEKQELDSEPAFASRYEEQQQQQVQLEEQQAQYQSAEIKGGARKGAPQASFIGLEQVKQEQESSFAPQLPVGEPEPYQFSYQVDGSSRSEQGDTKGVVRGQYTLQGADGASRVVDYVADHNGFRATVNTNEFGTESKSPANVQLRTSQPLAEEITIRADPARIASLKPLRLEATKGARREETRYETVKGYAQLEQPKEVQYPIKSQQSAELRAPEQLPQQQQQQEPLRATDDLLEQPQQAPRYGKQPQVSRTFESATAHQYERKLPLSPAATRARATYLRPAVL